MPSVEVSALMQRRMGALNQRDVPALSALYAVDCRLAGRRLRGRFPGPRMLVQAGALKAPLA